MGYDGVDTVAGVAVVTVVVGCVDTCVEGLLSANSSRGAFSASIMMSPTAFIYETGTTYLLSLPSTIIVTFEGF